MKSRCEIWLSALDELGALCSVSTTHDALSVVRRVENEGEFFFTKTLPSYAKDLERSLDAGEIPIWLFSSFGRGRVDVTIPDGNGPNVRRLSHRGVPKLLGGFMDIIFNSTLEMDDSTFADLSEVSGGPVPRMRSTDDDAVVARMATAIYAVRQLCLMFSKERDMCSDELVDAAIEKYVILDSEMTHPLVMPELTSFSKVVCSEQYARWLGLSSVFP